eukprot:scaffold987_cov197-Pinguiococcus_pyrenoidosus.AAC.5
MRERRLNAPPNAVLRSEIFSSRIEREHQSSGMEAMCHTSMRDPLAKITREGLSSHCRLLRHCQTDRIC